MVVDISVLITEGIMIRERLFKIKMFKCNIFFSWSLFEMGHKKYQ